MKYTTVARNAANTKTHWIHYLKHQWRSVMWMLVIMGLSCLLLFCHWACFAPVFVLELLISWRLLSNIGRGHAGGTTNAAVITSVEPMTIAVIVNLSMGGGKPISAVQITQVPDAFGGAARVGLRVPVVCIYFPGRGEFASDRWGSVEPTPVAQITPDRDALEHAVKMIPTEDWAELEDALKQIPDVTTEGLHLLPAPAEGEGNQEQMSV